MAIGLGKVVDWMRGHGCEKLIKYTGNEFEIAGIGAAAGHLKLDIGKYKKKIKVLTEANELARALDDCQYLLCVTAAKVKGTLKEQINRIRIMIILGITQLRTLLAAPDRKDIEEELAKWTAHMNELNGAAMRIILPTTAIEKTALTKKKVKKVARKAKKKPKRIITIPVAKPKFEIWGARVYIPKLSQVMEYQGIRESELDSAAKLLP